MLYILEILISGLALSTAWIGYCTYQSIRVICIRLDRIEKRQEERAK